jgi:NADH-quinone oxidoreductase subunit N
LILTQFSIISLIIYIFIYIIHVFIGLTLSLTKLLGFTYNKKRNLLNSIAHLNLINKPLTYLIVINFFSLAGLPPLGGFFAKFYIFVALFEINALAILFLFIIVSCFSAFYYIKIIQILLFSVNPQPTFIKILPFSYCLILTLLSYIIIGFIFINHIIIELDLIEFLTLTLANNVVH